LISPAAQRAPTVRHEEVHLPSRTPGPAAQSADLRAYLDKRTKINVKLCFEGAVRIDGQVHGETSENHAVVMARPQWSPPSSGPHRGWFGGTISGEISAAKRAEIRPTAKVFANLTTPILVVHDGTVFEGHCTMNPEAKEERKVTPLALNQKRVIPRAAAGRNKLV
jgi:cytoskeletal protein CcmA (bactofilin family)